MFVSKPRMKPALRWKGRKMSDQIRAEIKASAKAFCHYSSGPSSVNSCCQGIGRCEMDAAIAEITRLRAEIATARREGMEEAAKWHEVRSKELLGKASVARNFRQLLRQCDFHTESAIAIRAAAGEEK